MSSRGPNDFDHGAFWDEYSDSWDQTTAPTVESGILGDEWEPRAGYAADTIERFVSPHLRPDSRVVELGPGGGRFSRHLVERCEELVLADVSGEMLKRANRACAGRCRELLMRDGSLAPLESASCDFAFSFDVFTHLESEEVFRYLAEVNRVLKPDGAFCLSTSTYESRLGFLSFVQQLRGNRHRIGTRYGGRMYPLSDSILRRFAEHSGFSVIDIESNRMRKNVIAVLRKERGARVWQFISEPELGARFEISERVGGSRRRDVYAARLTESGEQVLLMMGDPADASLRSCGEASVPSHPALAVPRRFEEVSGVGLVVYDNLNGRRLSSVLTEEVAQRREELAPLTGRLLEGLLEAHASGLAHGELGPDFVITGRAQGFVLLGLQVPGPSSRDLIQVEDIGGASSILRLVAPYCRAAEAVREIAGELELRPDTSVAERAIRLLKS